ncbi:MAG: glutaredoxin family protein [Proteobacteria bacterium]|nr:glutaredoxin family protein [Pseudomonadota bacterium]
MDDDGSVPTHNALALTLLTRRECSLCDEFRAELERWDDGRNCYVLTVVDIDTDPNLRARFGLRVPVLLHGEAELCAGRFNPVPLSALLPTK